MLVNYKKIYSFIKELPHFLDLLSPLLTIVFAPPRLLFKSLIYIFLDVSTTPKFFPIYFVSLTFVYKNPFESFVKPGVFCNGLLNFLLLSILSFLMLSFLFEWGRALMSGKNDSEDFMNDYVDLKD